MTIKILGSSSAGNCYVIEDVEGNQLLLECGLKFAEICKHIDFERLDCVLVSHLTHSDHSLSVDKFKENFVPVYSHDNMEVGYSTITKHWQIMPIGLFHNVECIGFIIRNKLEDKWCLFCTDTKGLPRIVDRYFDCMLLECNYNYDKVIENAQNGNLTNDGYKNHMALEDLVQWLRVRECKPKHLVAIHLSNNGNIDKDLVLQELKPFAENVYIAKKGVEFEV